MKNCHTAAHAATGLTTLPATEQDGPVTVYYPTAAAAQPTRYGPFTLEVAPDAAPAAGNGRLVMISHGSGGSPWVYAELAREFSEAERVKLTMVIVAINGWNRIAVGFRKLHPLAGDRAAA